MHIDEIEAFLALGSIPGLGSKRITRLVHHFGSAKSVLSSDINEIIAISKYSKLGDYWENALQKQEWKKDLDLALNSNVDLISFTDPRYPKSLRAIQDPPALLYIKGKLTEVDQRSIAVIGTRNASIYGLEMAEAISQDLVALGFTVVSGLARGIDTKAHFGALNAKGRTIGVIGSGLDNIYPRENSNLSLQIERSGALISEFSMLTPPDKQNFPQRNRIVSGLTLGTLLIEAPYKSGAMITMECAKTQNKKLFAIPGRADNEGFRGNHFLIKTGQAKLVENAQDIISHFNNLTPISSIKLPETKHFFLDADEQRLLNVMPTEEIGVDNLVLLMDLPVYQVNTILMGLVLKKAIKEFPGKIYKKLAGTTSVIAGLEKK